MNWESSIEYYRLVNQAVRDRLGGLHWGTARGPSAAFGRVRGRGGTLAAALGRPLAYERFEIGVAASGEAKDEARVIHTVRGAGYLPCEDQDGGQ